MLADLLGEKAQILIHETPIQDALRLLYLAKKNPDLPIERIVVQVENRKKFNEKLPTWYSAKCLLFSSLALEQATEEKVATWKATLLGGGTFADLTGGMGIDFWAMAHKFQKAFYLERNNELADFAAYNFCCLKCENVEILSEDSIDWLSKTEQHFDWIYLDPARRDGHQNKVFFLEDCEPNLIEIKDLLLEKATNILVKTSPMLDISEVLRKIGAVANVYVVALNNEVKEVLYHLRNNNISAPDIHAINIKKSGVAKFSFTLEQEKHALVAHGSPQKYLYEPNAALLKSGAYKILGVAYGLNKLHQHTHLYTSDTLVDTFPGRIFEVISVEKPDAKAVHQHLLPDRKANVSVRNYPGTVEEIRKKLKLADGGERYLFAATTVQNEKVVIIARKFIPNQS